jgi:BACON domain-containing protein
MNRYSIPLISLVIFSVSATGLTQSQDKTIDGVRSRYSTPPPDPVISLTSASLSFSSFIGDPAPPSKTVGISNVGAGTLNWTASASGGSWLSVSPGSGTGNGSITVSVNPAGLTAGNYSGTILVSASGAVSRSISVSYGVFVPAPPVPPAIALSATTLSFYSSIGQTTPLSQSVGISNSGGGTLFWSAVVASGSWLSVSPSSGSGNGTLTISANPSGLAAGNYSGSITVSATGAASRSLSVSLTMIFPCSYAVSPPSVSVPTQGGTGQLTVTATPSTCPWTALSNSAWLSIKGTASGAGSGTVTYEATANPTYTDRTASINIGGVLVPFVQAESPRDMSFSMASGGGISLTTSGDDGLLSTGYAHIQPERGSLGPAGMAILSYRTGGILVSEASVPLSNLLTSGRTYAEVTADGAINTGVAIANPNDRRAAITFTFTDATGASVRTGNTIVEAHGQIAGFLDESPFSGGRAIQGTFSFTSDVPVSVAAIRSRLNERSEFLMTTLPVIDTARTAATGGQVLPHFAAGNGWTTQLILLNPTAATMTGTLQFLNPGTGNTPGSTVSVNLDGQISSGGTYSVAPNSSRRFVVTSSAFLSGSVRIVPLGGAAPFPLAVFTYKPGDVTVTEAGTADTTGNNLRMYIESSDKVSSGIAIANTTSAPATVMLEATRFSDGRILATSAPFTLPPFGQLAGDLETLMPSLAKPVEAVLRISTTGSIISAIGFRMRFNERGDFLIAATLPASETISTDSTAKVFPQLAKGVGYNTQVILFSPVSPSTTPGPSGGLRFFDPSGKKLDLGLR